LEDDAWSLRIYGEAEDVWWLQYGKKRPCEHVAGTIAMLIQSVVNGDDFVSRYRLLKLGRKKALDCLGTYPDVINA
jgi:hypothetical protein